MRTFLGFSLLIVVQMMIACHAEGPVFKGLPSAKYQLEEEVGSAEWCEQLVRDFDFPNTGMSKTRIFVKNDTFFLVFNQESEFRIISYRNSVVYAVPYNMVLINGNKLKYDGVEYVMEHSGDSYPSKHGGRGKVGARLLKY